MIRRSFYRKAATLLLLAAMLSAAPLSFGQMLHSATNMALGGGGTAYTTGYEALFVNPANLHIHERPYRIQLAAGVFGFHADSPTPIRSSGQLQSAYLRLTEGSGRFGRLQPVGDYEAVLNRNYDGHEDLTSVRRSTGEYHWFGLYVAGDRRSYALAARTRFASHHETARGFYDTNWFPAGDGFELNRSLTHRYQTLHEIAVGYGEPYDFLSGLFPHVSKVTIGIAPKLVIPGAMLHSVIGERTTMPTGGEVMERVRSTDHLSTGRFSEWVDTAGDEVPVGLRAMSRTELFRPTGIGGGIDIGVTWLVTLGDDLSVIRGLEQQTRRSVRVSLSLTDLGFVRYRRNTLRLSGKETTEVTEIPERSVALFAGRPGDHLPFLAENGNLFWNDTSRETGSRTMMLPTSLNGGLLLQLDRVRLMSDIRIALTEDAFQAAGPVTYLGIEFRPVRALPLRAGTRLTPGQDDYYSFGFGVEAGRVEFGMAYQLRSHSGVPSGEPAGISAGSLRVHLR